MQYGLVEMRNAHKFVIKILKEKNLRSGASILLHTRVTTVMTDWFSGHACQNHKTWHL